MAPRRRLGQHFLIDDNILEVIGRLAALTQADNVLEVGPGLGVLTRYLADRVAHVHAVEVDRRLEPELAALGARDNVSLHFADALSIDLHALQPRPGKLVANLPYNIAAPLLAETLDGLPAVTLWCVMVQREIAERLFARPRTKAYGGLSVLVQLAVERTGFHPVSREVFRPRPNVDSAIVAFRRIPLPDCFAEIRRLIGAAFAHRRKTLPNSLQLAGYARRERAAEALAALGHGAATRAEALEPPEFVALLRALL